MKEEGLTCARTWRISTGGNVFINSGRSMLSSSGQISVLTSRSGHEGASGPILLGTGTASTGDSGSIYLMTGTSVEGKPGQVVLRAGITFDEGSEALPTIIQAGHSNTDTGGFALLHSGYSHASSSGIVDIATANAGLQGRVVLYS